ncbi:MAG: hypothetical protein PPP56_08750 [Longimonas sp.]|uniref:hypothetical protein n=1 Tax=Longimonas sp. TaxID=2039626 RepID=UPI0033582B19
MSTPPLTQHVDVVYTLMAALVGSHQAPALTYQVFERAADVPPRKRPDDRLLWLLELALQVYTEHMAEDGTDGYDMRREAAETIVQKTLPSAWAACSPHTRTLLTARFVLDLSPAAVGQLIEQPADEVEQAIAAARASLRATLRDMMSGGQRMLVDTAFPDEELNASLRTFLNKTHGTPPAELRSQVARALKAERTASAQTRSQRTERRRSQWLKTSAVIAGLLALVVLAWGVRSVWTASADADDDQPSLIEFSVQHADVLTSIIQSDNADSLQAVWEAETGSTLRVPRIERAQLTGLAALPLNPEPVPVLQYRDIDAQASIRVFAYSYAQLDQLEEQAVLPRPIRQTLDSEDTFVEQSVQGRPILVWRVRDRVYLAVFASAARDARPERVEPERE